MRLNGLTSLGRRQCELAGIANEVEFFDCKGVELALLPGGKVTLGFDPKGGFPDAEQGRSWKKSLCWKQNKYALKEFLKDSMAPLRTVHLEPFLIEVKPTALGLTPAKEDLPEVIRILEGKASQIFSANGTFKRIGERVFLVNYPSHSDISRSAALEGFRLPTPDEWEYACSGGARTVFRWGNECPLDRDPIAGGTFDLHRKRNAFGLEFPSNPFNLEVTDDPAILRGGDGGGMICGAVGWLPSWLTLATSFVQPGDADRGTPIIHAHLRRARSLSPEDTRHGASK